MKKIAAISLTVLMIITLAACGREKETMGEKTSDTENTTETLSGEVASTENDTAESSMPEDVSEWLKTNGIIE